MRKNPDKPARNADRRSGPREDQPLRSRGMKGPPKDAPAKSRGQRSHGALQQSRKSGGKGGGKGGDGGGGSGGRPGTTRDSKGTRRARNKGTTSNRKGWIWGTHAVMGVLANSSRTVHELLMTEAAERRLAPFTPPLPARIVEPHDLDRMLPPGATHQGLAVHAAPLEWPTLRTISETSDLVLVLDQVTDPHNLGAMFRLASAFGVGALILQDRHAPPLNGATAKVATGCIETVPAHHVTNIADALQELHALGYQSVGLAGETDLTIADALSGGGKFALVMGAEGRGLRPRVAQTCDRLAAIPMQSDGTPGTAESLNVSTAAAIALYEARRNGSGPT